MSEHLSEEMIILLHYGEHVDGGAREHLESCETCRNEATRLAEFLALVELPVDEPDEAFEERMWSRVSWRLQGAKRRSRRVFGTAAAAAALVIVGLLAGLWINRPATVTPDTTAVASNDAPTESGGERVLLVVVSSHLDRAERVLVELSRAPTDVSRSIVHEKKSANDLVAANRLFRLTAADHDPRLAALLEEIEPVLVELARAPDDMSPEDLRALQARVESEGLIFKLRVSGARVRSQTASQGPSV